MKAKLANKKIQCQFVLHNDCETIEKCLDSVLRSKFNELIANFVVFDNSSNDNSVNVIENKYGRDIEVVKLDSNIGFSCAHNLGISQALNRGCDFVAILNPDLLLEETCLENLALALDPDRKIGVSCPKLYRTSFDFEKDHSKIDAAGMFFQQNLRHLDRTEEYDSLSKNDTQKLFNHCQYAIGASGACFVISKECIKEVSFPKDLIGNDNSSLFDPDFFAYREDAELGLRMQWLAWKTIYIPTAIGYHKRFVTPNNRNKVPPIYNRMSVRNRFLLQGNNISLALLILTFPYSWFRNLVVILATIITERSSLLGLKEVFTLRHKTLAKRKWIFRNAKNSNLIIHHWFDRNYAFPPALSLCRDAFSKSQNNSKKEELKEVSLCAVIISYFQSLEIEDCVDSLLEHKPENLKLTIKIINNSIDDKNFNSCKDKINSKKEANIEFIELNKNLGFSGAINEALKNCTDKFFLILNPDIILQASSISRCLSSFQIYNNLGAVAPLLYEKGNKLIQPTYGPKRFPTTITLLSELPGINKLLPKNSIARFQHYQDEFLVSQCIQKQTGCCEVEQLAGACLFIRDTAYHEIGGFDEAFYPAWHEDVDFCINLYKKNYVAAIQCNASAYHIGGTSTKSLDKSKFLFIYYKNYVRLWNKHQFGPQRILGIMLLSLSFLIKRLFSIDFRSKYVLESLKTSFIEAWQISTYRDRMK